MYQFFCIVEEEGARDSRRVPLEGGLQETISGEFDRQVRDLVPEGIEILSYDPGYKPDEELFRIESYPLPTYIEAAVNTPDGLPILDSDELAAGHVKSLFGVELERSATPPLMAFQNFNSGQVVQRGFRFLFLERDLFQRSDRTGLKVDTKVSSVIQNGDLLFQSEHLVRRYLELDRYFREATDEEISGLLRHSSIAPTDHASFIDFADRWIRRKTTSIVERKILDRVSVEKIVRTGRQFELEVRTTEVEGQLTITVPTEKREVKALLRLLDDDLLESALTDAKYQVSSKRKI